MQSKKSVLLTTMVDTHIHARTKQQAKASFVVASCRIFIGVRPFSLGLTKIHLKKRFGLLDLFLKFKNSPFRQKLSLTLPLELSQ
jgi:hypothetical protein